MGRAYIDRISDKARHRVLLALMHGPSLGAITVAGGLAAGAMGTAVLSGLAAYAYYRAKWDDYPPSIVYSRAYAPARIQEMSARIAQRFGIKDRIPVYIHNRDLYPAFVVDHDVFFSKEMMRFLRRPEKEFVMAHEHAHIKAGDTGAMQVQLRASSLIEPFTAGIGGFSLASVFSTGNIPLLMVSSAVCMFGGVIGQNLLRAFNSRSMERRRDYEAVQATGDIDSAISAITKLEGLKRVEDYTLRERIFSTHPLGEARLKNLRIAYEDGIRSGVIYSPALQPA